MLASGASVALGLALVWWFVTPQSLSRTGTGELVAVLGLFVLPVITMATWLLERRSPSRGGSIGGVEAETSEAPALVLPNAVIIEREIAAAAGRDAGDAARRPRDEDSRRQAARSSVVGRA